MGHRAHYVIKSGDSWERYYSQWGGLSIELDLLAGPEAAMRFVQGQRRVDWWMNEVECDGAVIIDAGERRLLWFADFLGEPAYRAAVQDVMARTWPGWRIDWAYDGLREIVRALGGNEEDVERWRSIPVGEDIRTPEKFMAAMPNFQLSPEVYPPGSQLPPELPLAPLRPDPAAHDEPASLITVTQGGTTKAYMADVGASWIIEAGTGLLATLAKWDPVSEWPSFPRCGMHLDVDARTGGVWTFGVLYGILDEAESLWPGWHWEFWRERHAEHLDRIGDAIVLPKVDRARGLAELAEKFGEHQHLDRGTEAASLLLGFMGALKGAAESKGMDVRTVTDNAMTHRPMDLTPEEFAGVQAALTELRHR